MKFQSIFGTGIIRELRNSAMGSGINIRITVKTGMLSRIILARGMERFIMSLKRLG